jgi:hypothetical protein
VQAVAKANGRKQVASKGPGRGRHPIVDNRDTAARHAEGRNDPRAGEFRHRHDAQDPPRQPRQHPAVPPPERPRKGIGKVQGGGVMYRDDLPPVADGARVPRGEQHPAAQAHREHKLLPEVPACSLGPDRRCHPLEIATQAGVEFAHIALHPRQGRGQRAHVVDDAVHVEIRWRCAGALMGAGGSLPAGHRPCSRRPGSRARAPQ